MEALGGREVELLLILDLGTRWGWVIRVTPRPHFTPGESTPGTHWTGGWVSPRAGLDTRGLRKNPLPLLGIEPRSPGRPARSQTIYCLSYPGSKIPRYTIKIMQNNRRSWIDQPTGYSDVTAVKHGSKTRTRGKKTNRSGRNENFKALCRIYKTRQKRNTQWNSWETKTSDIGCSF
jgi:hypothetical protein